MDTLRLCPKCAAPLPADAPAGLCPKCLLNAGFESQSGAAINPTSGFTPPEPSELARDFPQLEVMELLGMGGMGVVYKARQVTLDRVVALKILPPDIGKDPAFAERFTREARALAKLSHPNIVGIFDFGQAGKYYYFLMEFVDGVNLRQMLSAHRVEPREALAIVPQICDALQYAHDQGIVHRDIKPENILVDRRGRVRIADFGLARLLGPSVDLRLTQSQHVMGTPNYMAPEQLEKPLTVDHRADIYSLGVVFYEMLTGELPLGRFEVPSQKVRVDVRLDDIVIKTLAKEPERRYQHASDVKTEMEALSGVPFSQLPPGLRNLAGTEYRSKTELLGLPLLHVSMGYDPATGKQREARGIVAVGGRATGVIAIGGFAKGIIAYGGIAIGVVAIGGIGLGVFCLGGLVMAMALAWGGVALAPLAFGGLAIGYYACGGLGFGAHVAASNAFADPMAQRFFMSWMRPSINVLVLVILLVPMFAQMLILMWARRQSKASAVAPSEPSRVGPPRMSGKAVLGAFWFPLLPVAACGFLLTTYAIRQVEVVSQSSVSPTIEYRKGTDLVSSNENRRTAERPNISSRPGANIPGERNQPIVVDAQPAIVFRIVMLFVGLLGLTAPFGTTILGIASINDIRRSQGRIYGMPLALFDALAYPLLLLDALIVAAAMGLVALGGAVVVRVFQARAAMGWGEIGIIGGSLGLIAALALDAVLVMMAWRAVTKPVS